jgi:hypothetical protein
MKQRAVLVAFSTLGIAAGAVSITVVLSLPALLPRTEAPGSVTGITLGPSAAEDPRPRTDRLEPRASASKAKRSNREVRRPVARRSGATPSAPGEPVLISNPGGEPGSRSDQRNLPSPTDAPAGEPRHVAPPASNPVRAPEPQPAQPSPQPAAAPPDEDFTEESAAAAPVATERVEDEAVEQDDAAADEAAALEAPPAPTSLGGADQGGLEESDDSSAEAP